MSNQLEKIKELIDRRAVARQGGGEKAIAKQHEKGKYTARERIAMHQLRHGEKTLPGRWCRNRMWYDRWPSGLHFCTRLHRFSWFIV